MPARARPRVALLLPALAALLAASGALAQMQFTDVTATPGSELDSPVDVQGVAWGDCDNDGDDDVYLTLVLSALIDSGKRLYRNDGGDVFREVAGPAGVSDDQTGFGAAWGDYDNDTDADLLLANGALSLIPDALRLYANEGYGTFVDKAAAAGITSPGSGRSIVWADYDNDSHLDFFLCTPSLEREYLYRGNGDGTFSDVTAAAGITVERNAAGAAWADYDRDGDVDLYVVDHGIAPFIVERNRLYRNNGDGTFTEAAAAAGVDDDGSGNGAAWGDCDNDGDLDLYVANGLDIFSIFGINAPNRLYRNDGGTFTNVAAAAGVEDSAQIGFSATWGDFDNDGWLDLYVTNSRLSNNDPANRLFRNLGNCTFTDVAAAAGVQHRGAGQGTASADYDDDGDLDLFVASLFGEGNVTARLFRNDTPARRWLVVHLVGTNSNRDGMGAYVEVHAGATTFTRQANGGSGYISQDSLDAEFGLGDLASVDDVTVRWPSGCVQVFPNPALDQYLTIVEDCILGFDAASFTEDPCAPGVTLSWEAARFDSASGHYEVRRGRDCADASRQLELLPRPSGTTFVDTTTIAGETYAYVIRAWDDVNGTWAEQCVLPVVDVDGSAFAATADATSPVCPGTPADYTATGPPGATFAWDFDVAADADGNTIADDDVEAATATASHAFATGGTYVARVTVTSAEGCARALDATVVVEADSGPTVDPASLRVTRVGPDDPLLAWTLLAGSGDTNVHRTLDKSEWAGGPPAVAVVAVAPGTSHLDSVALASGECAFYQVFGRPCGP